MRRLVILSLLTFSLTSASASEAAEQRIAPGVTAGGVALGDLTVPEAAAALDQRLLPALDRDLVIRAAGKRFAIAPTTIGFSFDADATAARAAQLGPSPTPQSVALAARFDRSATASVAARVARSVNRPARAAALRGISSRAVSWRRSRTGLEVTADAVASAIADAAPDPATRLVQLDVRVTAPDVSDNNLRRAYPSIVTVDKRTFTLRLFRNLRQTATYRIAHGQPAYPTPSGRFRITSKQVNPNWYVPSSPWAGELAGSVIPGGASNNPLKARWMGLADGIGIHGTGDEASIGSRASHGCVRMRVRDVKRLFTQVRVGTPVVIG